SPARAAENIFFRFNYITETVDYDPAVKDALLNQFLKSQKLMDILNPLLPQAGQKALQDLIGNKDFIHLDPRTRFALLSQIKNYPDERVIKNLTLLAGNHWFADCELGDQQRFAKVFAFLSQYTGGNEKIRDNTLQYLLGPGPKMKWGTFDGST